jgi:hypothetical protein
MHMHYHAKGSVFSLLQLVVENHWGGKLLLDRDKLFSCISHINKCRIFRRKGRLDLWIHLEPPTLVDVESMVRSFVASLGDEVSPDWLSKICNKFRDK